MCRLVWKGDEQYWSAQEVSELLGVPIIWEGEPFVPESCLCCVDVGAMMKQAGVQYEYDPTFSDYIIQGAGGQQP